MLRRRGRLVPVAWDELLDDLASSLGRVTGAPAPTPSAPTSVHCPAGTRRGEPSAKLSTAALGSRSRYTSTTTDCPAKPLVAQAVLGHAAITPLPDLDSIGHAAARRHQPSGVARPHVGATGSGRGPPSSPAARGEVWVVDPRTTETARLATGHLAPRAGTDHAVLGHILRELLEHGADDAYLRAHAKGTAELAAAVQRYDADARGRRHGPRARRVGRTGHRRAPGGPPAVLTGTGVTMGADANLTEWFATALVLVTGSLDRPGGMWCNPGLLARLDQAGIDAHKSKPAQPGPPSRPELPRRFGQYPCAAMADEIESGNLRALVSLAGNPVVSFADSDRVAAAFGRLEVLAVADVHRTATAELATHVLPCTGSFERPDATFGAELYQPQVAAQYVPALVAPVAERRPLWWILAQLGRRLGFDVLPDGLDADLVSTADDAVLDAVVGADRLAELRATPSGATAAVDRFGWVVDVDRPPFDLAPPELVAELDRVHTPAPLVLVPRRQGRHLNSWFPPAELRQDHPGVLVHPTDAADAGLADGQRVRVRSAAGAVEGTITVDHELARGAVSIPHGFGSPLGPNVAALISSTFDIDPLTGMARQSGVPVSLEPADPPQGAEQASGQ